MFIGGRISKTAALFVSSPTFVVLALVDVFAPTKESSSLIPARRKW